MDGEEETILISLDTLVGGSSTGISMKLHDSALADEVKLYFTVVESVLEIIHE